MKRRFVLHESSRRKWLMRQTPKGDRMMASVMEEDMSESRLYREHSKEEPLEQAHRRGEA